MADNPWQMTPARNAPGNTWGNWMNQGQTNYPYPPINHNQPIPMRPTGVDPLDSMFTDAQRGYGNAMQGAMGQMAGMNLANQGASLHLRDLAAQQQRDFWGARIGMMNAMAPVMQEQFRAQALAQILGMGSGGGPAANHPTRYTSNIGQGINMYPHWRR